MECELECSPREAVIRWAQERLADSNAMYLDTETTGLDEGAEIVELAVPAGAGQPLIDTLIQPRFWIPAAASDLHGITNELVRDAPTWRVVAPIVQELLEAASAVVLRMPNPVAYNEAKETIEGNHHQRLQLREPGACEVFRRANPLTPGCLMDIGPSLRIGYTPGRADTFRYTTNVSDRKRTDHARAPLGRYGRRGAHHRSS